MPEPPPLVNVAFQVTDPLAGIVNVGVGLAYVLVILITLPGYPVKVAPVMEKYK